MSNSTKNYIGYKFSLQKYLDSFPSHVIPIPEWAIRCDGARVYLTDDGQLTMDAVRPEADGNIITGYTVDEKWMKEE